MEESGEEDEESDGSDSYSDMGSDNDEDNQTEPTSSNIEDENAEHEFTVDTNTADIPFVIEIPVKYKDFEVLLKKCKAHYKNKGQSSSALNIVLTRMITYNKATDRSRLPKLFNFIVRYTIDMAEKSKKLTNLLLMNYRVAIPHLHTLLLLNPNECVHEVETGEIFDDFYPMKGLPIHKVG